MNQLSTIQTAPEGEVLPPAEVSFGATTAPSKEVLLKEVAPLVELADIIMIDSDELYEVAGAELVAIKAKQKALEEQRLGITRGLDQTKKLIMDLFKPAQDKLAQGERSLKNAMLTYDREQEAKAAAARKAVEDAAAAERAAMQKQAEDAAEQGDHTTAMTLAATAEMVTAAPPVVEAPRASGIAKTTRWSAEVTDKVAYFKYVLEHRPDLIDTLEVDMKPLNQLAVALKEKLALPGIKAVATTGLSARGR